MKTEADMRNKRYCEAEKELFQALYEREKWYLGEQLKSDPTLSEIGRKMLEQRMMSCILSGFGKWASEQIKKSGIVTE